MSSKNVKRDQSVCDCRRQRSRFCPAAVETQSVKSRPSYRTRNGFTARLPAHVLRAKINSSSSSNHMTRSALPPLYICLPLICTHLYVTVPTFYAALICMQSAPIALLIRCKLHFIAVCLYTCNDNKSNRHIVTIY